MISNRCKFCGKKLYFSTMIYYDAYFDCYNIDCQSYIKNSENYNYYLKFGDQNLLAENSCFKVNGNVYLCHYADNHLCIYDVTNYPGLPVTEENNIYIDNIEKFQLYLMLL